MKIRLWGTQDQIDEMLALLKTQLGDRVLSVSRPYKDSNGSNYRVYVDISD